MSSSFNGVSISVLADGIPRKSAADVSVRHIAGGNQTYVDVGGQQLQVLDLSLLFLAAADAVSFEGQLGQTGTLITPDGTRQALLTSLTRTTRGLSSSGDTVLQAEFQLL